MKKVFEARRSVHEVFMRLCLMMTLSVALLGSLTFAADAIEGTSWKVQVTAIDGGKDFSDVLTFKAGQFSDEALTKKGFKPARYEDNTVRMGPATFEVTLESPASGKAKWNASIAADQMTGTMVWTKADGSATNYSFTGERVSRK